MISDKFMHILSFWMRTPRRPLMNDTINESLVISYGFAVLCCLGNIIFLTIDYFTLNHSNCNTLLLLIYKIKRPW